MPARVVRSADVAYFPGPNQSVQGLQCLVQRRLAIPFVKLIKVDSICPEALKTLFTFANEMITGRTAVVRSGADDHSCFGSEKQVLPAPFQNLAKDFFGQPVRIAVCRVKKINACFDAEIHLAPGTRDIRRSYFAEDAAATEGHCAQAEYRDHKAGLS